MSARLYLGWETTVRGAIYLDHHHFANFWQNPADYPQKLRGKWILNRSALAIEYGVPSNLPGFESPDALLDYLARWIGATGL